MDTMDISYLITPDKKNKTWFETLSFGYFYPCPAAAYKNALKNSNARNFILKKYSGQRSNGCFIGQKLQEETKVSRKEMLLSLKTND